MSWWTEKKNAKKKARIFAARAAAKRRAEAAQRAIELERQRTAAEQAAAAQRVAAANAAAAQRKAAEKRQAEYTASLAKVTDTMKESYDNLASQQRKSVVRMPTEFDQDQSRAIGRIRKRSRGRYGRSSTILTG